MFHSYQRLLHRPPNFYDFFMVVTYHYFYLNLSHLGAGAFGGGKLLKRLTCFRQGLLKFPK
jgi:hypothetical protein